jgi:hypothetical protein
VVSWPLMQATEGSLWCLGHSCTQRRAVGGVLATHAGNGGQFVVSWPLMQATEVFPHSHSADLWPATLFHMPEATLLQYLPLVEFTYQATFTDYRGECRAGTGRRGR